MTHRDIHGHTPLICAFSQYNTIVKGWVNKIVPQISLLLTVTLQAKTDMRFSVTYRLGEVS